MSTIAQAIREHREASNRSKSQRYVVLVKKSLTGLLTAAELAELDQLLSDLGVSLTEFARITADLAECRNLMAQELTLRSKASALRTAFDKSKAALEKLQAEQHAAEVRECRPYSAKGGADAWREIQHAAAAVKAEYADKLAAATEAYKVATANLQADPYTPMLNRLGQLRSTCAAFL